MRTIYPPDFFPAKQNDREAVGSAEGSAKRIPDKA
jgi:hypothetical protein